MCIGSGRTSNRTITCRFPWVLARFRYRQPLQSATLTVHGQDLATLVFDEPQSGIAAGQFAAWHDAETGEEVLGSGVIA